MGTPRDVDGIRPPSGALLGAVGAAYAAVSFALVGRLGYGWDETIYLSQVGRGVPAAFFSAPRARGITWIAGPVAALTLNHWAVRAYLALAAAAALVGAYWPWLRLRRGLTVPLAAAVFAVLWPALFYGPQAMPDLWVAFGGVGAVGWFLRAGETDPARRRWAAAAGVAAWLALATVVRPSDAAWLAGPLLVAALAVPRWRRGWSLATAVVAGFAAGLLPWLVEAVVSFGGPVARLHRATAIEGGTSLRWNVVTVLRAVNGPTLCRPCTKPVPATGVLLWLAGAAAVVVALATARRERRVASTVLPTVVAASVAVPYLFLIGYAAPRFLLPAYALLAIAVADGVASTAGALAARGARGLAAGTVTVVLVGLLAYQGTVAAASVRGSQRQRAAWDRAVAALHASGVHPPCVVSGDQAPPIAFAAGCASRQTGGHDRSISLAGLLRLAAREPTAVVYRHYRNRPPWATGWRRLRQPTKGYGTWTIFVAPR